MEVIYVWRCSARGNLCGTDHTIPYLNYVVIPASDALKPKKNCFLFAVFRIGILYLHIIVHVVFVNLTFLIGFPPLRVFTVFLIFTPSVNCAQQSTTTMYQHHGQRDNEVKFVCFKSCFCL